MVQEQQLDRHAFRPCTHDQQLQQLHTVRCCLHLLMTLHPHTLSPHFAPARHTAPSSVFSGNRDFLLGLCFASR